MSLVLVVEPEGRWVERIRDALGGEGIRVKAVNEREAALRSVAEESPDLVLVNYELAGAPDLFAAFGRGRGGPGVVALIPERATAAGIEADDSLRKPFSESQLRLLVKRNLAMARGGRRPSSVETTSSPLSSRELFADLLEEVERDDEAAAGMGQPEPPPQPAPAGPPGLPRSPAAAGPRPPVPPPPAATTVEAKLEQTLSGLRRAERGARSAAAEPSVAARRQDVDRLLSATLADLNLKPKPVATPPASPARPSLPVPPAAPARTAGEATAARPASPPSTEVPPARIPASEFATQRVPIIRPAPPPPAPAQAAALPPVTAPVQVPPKVGKAPKAKAEAGREFGPYTLLERIAVGGMAEVWKAKRSGLEGFQKLVAIKRILPHLNDNPDFVAMLIDEAKLAAQLTHPNVTQIYDLGKIGDDHYIAMEFIDGKDLRAVLNTLRARGEALPRNLALLIAARVAGALDYAHHKRDFEGRPLGLVHRDVSPQNVLISHDGIIKLCDFGIVKAVSRAHQTQMGALKGKLQYMSPEQAWGRAVDGRSDVFSLGSLVFEMLTGRRVFAGDTEISILESVREGRVPRLADVAPDVPVPVQALVTKALERDPADRFATAGEMQREIERLLAEARPVPTEADLAQLLRRLFGAGAALAPAAEASALSSAPSQPSAITGAGSRPGTAAGASVAPAPVGVEAEIEAPVIVAAPIVKSSAPAKGRAGLWIGVAAGVLIAVGVAMMLSRASSAPADETGAADSTLPTAAPPGVEASVTTDGASPPLAGDSTASAVAPPETEAGAEAVAPSEGAAAGTPADRSLAELVDQEFARREQALRQQYEVEKRRLEDQLREARSQQAAPAPVAAAAATAPPPSAPAPEAPPVGAPAAAPLETGAPPAGGEVASAATEPTAAAVDPAPAPAPAEPPRAPAPVERGSLVTMGAGVVPPQLVSRLDPRYPPLARVRRLEGSVTVEVLVDENGTVVQTRLLKGDDRGLGFNEAAIAAAQSARFRPATKNGVAVRMWKSLVFPFTL
jgi:TonB family protein